MEEAKEKIENVNKELMNIKIFEMFNANTGMPPGVLALGAVILAFLICVMQLPFSNYVVHLIGTAYPVYKSFEALGTEDDAEDDKHWLTYWMVFSLFNFIDTNLNFLL